MWKWEERKTYKYGHHLYDIYEDSKLRGSFVRKEDAVEYCKWRNKKDKETCAATSATVP